jgi:hypothetical protein
MLLVALMPVQMILFIIQMIMDKRGIHQVLHHILGHQCQYQVVDNTLLLALKMGLVTFIIQVIKELLGVNQILHKVFGRQSQYQVENNMQLVVFQVDKFINV